MGIRFVHNFFLMFLGCRRRLLLDRVGSIELCRVVGFGNVYHIGNLLHRSHIEGEEGGGVIGYVTQSLHITRSPMVIVGVRFTLGIAV